MYVSPSRYALHGALTLVVLFYSLLPYLGTAAWHPFVPEHDHWFLGQHTHTEADLNELAPTEPNNVTCDKQSALYPHETVVHAVNPASALQLLSMVVDLGVLANLVPPPGIVTRLTTLALFLKEPVLSPLDPPPNAA